MVTGASGFVGSNLTRRLVSEGYQVAVLKRPASSLWRIEDLAGRLRAYDADLCDLDAVRRAFADFRPQAVCHLVAYYAIDHRPDDVAPLLQTNVVGSANLLEAAKECAVSLFVNTSSCFVYRQSRRPLNEASPLGPLNLYAATKIQAEQMCDFYREQYGVACATLRLFPPYGPLDHERKLIPYVIRCYRDGIPPRLTSGKQQWDFVYVHDIVEAYFKLLRLPALAEGHAVFNIGSGRPVAVSDVVYRIKEIFRSSIEPTLDAMKHRPNEVWFMCADVAKASKILDWKPKIDVIKDGLALTIDWWTEHWRRKQT